MVFKLLFRHSRTSRANRGQRWVALILLVFALLFTTLGLGQWSVAQAVGTVSGLVFDDNNFNGVQEASEGVPSVTGLITLYPVSGAVITANVTAGTFSAAGVPDGQYRVELTGLPTGVNPSYGTTATGASGSVVRFITVTNGAAVSLKFGVTLPASAGSNSQTLCSTIGNNSAGQPNFINVAVPCFGAYTGGFLNSVNLADAQPTDKAVVRFQTNQQATSPTNSPTHVVLATLGQVGATFGADYARAFNGTIDTQKTFVAAYNKRATGYGPGGSGAIYAISNSNNPTGPYPVAQWATVPGGAGHNHDYTYNPSLPAGKTIFDQASSDVVGKAGLGGITINESETVLYAMALGDRKIYRYTGLANGSGTLTPANSVIDTRSILPTGVILPNATGDYSANDAPGACRSDDFRPFAVKYYHGKLYIGAVCSAESTVPANAPDDAGLFSAPGVFATPLYQLDKAGQRSRLRAYVFAINGDGTGNATSVLNTNQDGGPGFPLTYLSDPAWYNSGATAGPINYNRIWLPWRNYNGNLSLADRTLQRPFTVYPEPMLSDLDFDLNGNMILAFRDRVGDQSSSAPKDSQSSSSLPGDNLISVITGGDVLRATPTGASWRIESDLQYPTNTTQLFNVAPDPNTNTIPNSEFYTGDNFVPSHYETANGSLAQYPDQQIVLATAFDPYAIQTGGVYWMDNTTGGLSNNRKEEVYPQAASQFGKANGLGDVTMLCRLPRPQIGNRIWFDNNHNGIQDANDFGVAGVKVELLNANSQPVLDEVSGLPITAVTVADGTYYFPVALNVQYRVRVNYADTTLAPGQTATNKALLSDLGWNYTLQNIGPVSANSKADLATGITGLSASLGGAQVDHTLDIGFWLAVPPTPTATASPTATPTPTVTATPVPATAPPGSTATPISTPTPTSTSTVALSPSPSPSGSITPATTVSPTTPPTVAPTVTATPSPTATTPAAGGPTPTTRGGIVSPRAVLPNTGRAEVQSPQSEAGFEGGRWLLIGLLWLIGGGLAYRAWRRPGRQ